MRLNKILSMARITLADPNQERWDDATLIAILNEGLLDFCRQTEMLHERILVPVTEGDPYFDLPEDCWTLTRVLYDNCPLPFVTHRELDGSRRCWETDRGEPEAIIYDRRNMVRGKLYPIPEFGDVEGSTEAVSLLGLFGSIVTSSTGVIAPPFGVTNSGLGVATAVIGDATTPGTGELLCYYLNRPNELVDGTSEIDTPEIYDSALKFYLCGHAFLNDIDTANQQKGAAQLMIYDTHVRTAKRDSSHYWTRAAQFETTYRGIR